MELYEKYRPTTMDDMVLLPRIKEILKDGINQNYIFYGSYGGGKTSVAKILAGMYIKKDGYQVIPSMYINCSEDGVIDTLRNDITRFCEVRQMMSESDIKYVILDEFDGVSSKFELALKAFIERYKNVRFIFITNHIEDIYGGVLSRVQRINFDAQSREEEVIIKKEFFKRVNRILELENVEAKKEDIIELINTSFPDFRNTLVNLQTYISGGGVISGNTFSIKERNELYEFISIRRDVHDVISFINKNIGSDRINILFRELSNPYIYFLMERGVDSSVIFELISVYSDEYPKIKTQIDPLLLGVNLINKYQNILLK